jgi:hypothetical protein
MYTDLTLYQKHMVSVSGNPELLSQFLPDTLPPFSLNNDRSFAPPKEPTVIPRNFHAAAYQNGDTFGHDSGWPSQLDPQSKRSLLKSYLSDFGFEKFSFHYWNFIDAFKYEVSISGLIKNSEWQPFKSFNFMNCYKRIQKGNLLVYETNEASDLFKVQKMSCGIKYCPWCTTKKRSSIAAEYTSVAKDAFQRYGMEKVWSFVFTLPESLENQLWSDHVKIRNKIVKIVKKTFKVKSRENLGILIAEHPVGSTDIIRKRLHFHALVFPLVMSEKTGTQYIKKESIDLVRLKNAWLDALDYTGPIANPQVKWYDLTSPENLAKIGHRIKYDLRSFAESFENSVVVHSDKLDLVVLKADQQGLLGWRVYKLSDYADHYVWCLDHSFIQPYGWLQKIKHWKEVGMLTSKDEGIQAQPYKIDTCEIELIRHRTYSAKMQRVVWIRKEFCYYMGIRYEIGKEIKYV